MSHPTEELTAIRIRGAREHNLKSVSLDIPRDQLVVITGLSGSGKSSLAFDTIYAEGQRRYVECMSAYARQFLGIMKKPDVDVIEGLSPAISIEQKSVGHNPRSTVGTVTEIYDYLRLLFARVGTQYCTNCGIPVEQRTTEQILDAVLATYSQRKCQILAPLVKGRKGHYRELFDQLRRQGFTKVRVNAQLQDLVEGMQLPRYKTHVIELVVDRLEVAEQHRKRLAESIETALALGDGGITILYQAADMSWSEAYFSTSYSCPQCGKSYDTPSPSMFSFNSPFGACSTCNGLGVRSDFDTALMIPDPSLSIAGGGIGPLGKQRDTWLWKQVSAYAESVGLDVNTPIGELDAQKLNVFIHGGDQKQVKVNYGHRIVKHTFLGLIPTLRHQYEQASTSSMRKNLEQYLKVADCDVCGGARLKPDHVHVRVAGYNIQECTAQTISEALEWFRQLLPQLTPRQSIIATPIVKEITERLTFLDHVGLSYLTLARSARTLSGGESQRIRLASQIGSQLVGVTYVLDEPSIGLHQHDNQKLISSLKSLRNLGNTVIVVEHDREMISEADYVIDIGPGAGVRGGEIVARIKNGQPISDEHAAAGSTNRSITLEYLTGARHIPIPTSYRPGNGQYLRLHGARGNNLKDVNLFLPLGTFICVTGMSGSGKSTLINHTLYPILARHFSHAETVPLPYTQVDGLEHIDKVIEIDQSPIGRTPRSNPATYTGLFTHIRDFFTMLPEARIRGYKSGRFSFNVAGGRCETCEGAGLRKIEMSFLPDVYVNCEACNGKRYNAETLSVHYRGKSIADVLDLTVEEALEFFADIPKIRTRLETLVNVGLTYLRLGQQAPTLSGGEAQRVKLATELSKTSTGKTLYLLDEPTTGLHFEDIRILLSMLDALVDKGNTVVVIEHNLDVIAHADHIIDLGPGSGADGGRIVATGTPQQVASVSDSLTGFYLKREFAVARI